ncbi:putative MFS family arabinose efflux permease [Rubricella aquisinus]|uniref:Putative MFS family arabinose efflux permease n=1 Tax=Rubricella aquisinus TaxID=2028108 RepID=A0A840X6I7_9RHOB|nr:MFS transporter [Rubricella aquisinus]MBB5516317.1 putative MFS family arabinose efflux permease [Rubricella aquisinus]
MIARLIRNPVFPMAGIVLIGLLIGLLALSERVLQLSERDLQPELERKAVAVGLSVRETMERALDYEIPLAELNGMEAFLEVYRTDGGLGYIAVIADGQILFSSGPDAALALSEEEADATGAGVLELVRAPFRWFTAPAPQIGAFDDATVRQVPGYIDTALPLRADMEVVGTLHLGTDDAIIFAQLRDNLLDIATILLLSLLLAVELMLFALAYSVTGPMGEMRAVMQRVIDGKLGQLCRVSGPREVRRAQMALNDVIRKMRAGVGEDSTDILQKPRMIGVRLLAFLFVMAEEIARPFMPLFLSGFADTAPAALSPELTAGVIMSASMLIMAIMMPVSGVLVDRIGPRRLFGLGALVATTGLFGSAFAATFNEIIALRCLSVAGYGLCFIACQGYVIENSTTANRARGMGLFVGGIMMADLFGAAIGGIIAERLGFSATFMVGAGISALAGLLVWRLMEQRQQIKGEAMPRFRLSQMGALLINRRFMVVAVLAAIPAKLILVGVLYYLAPLYLTERALSQGDIGRVIMAYGIIAVLVLPVLSNLADHKLGYRNAVVWGSLIAAPLLMAVPYFDMLPVTLAAILFLGFGQALITTSLVPLVTVICATEMETVGQGAVLGTLRFIERIGSAFSPLVAAMLAQALGYDVAIAVYGVTGVVCAVLLAVLTRGAARS